MYVMWLKKMINHILSSLII